MNGAGSFLDANSPLVTDSLWVMSYSVIFGCLGAAVVLAAFFFIPLQLLCKVFSKNVPEYSWIDRFITRAMLIVNVLFVFIFTIVGIWATSAFYFNVDYPISNVHDQTFVLKQKYESYYTAATSLKSTTPPYDIMPAEPINEFHTMLSNGTTKLVDALDFMDTWVIRGAFGGMIPYTIPFVACIFTLIWVIRGRRLMYTVALLTTLLSLLCMMGVVIPNTAWAVLVSYECTSGLHATMGRYLDYYNPNNCVPDVIKSYIWMDNITRSACTPEPFAATQAKIDAARASNPVAPASAYLYAAEQAWSVMRDTGRTNVLYQRVVDQYCGATANRGATLFLCTILLWVYLLLNVYVLLFSTMRLKPQKHEEFHEFTNEEPNAQQLDTFRSNIRERVARDKFELDNSNVYWTLIGWGIIQALTFLLMGIAFGVGSQRVTINDSSTA